MDKAINRGAIAPGRRKHWLDLIYADPAMADVLASTPDETAVPLTEMGYNQDDELSVIGGGVVILPSRG